MIRVVVTGIGLITPLGVTVAKNWDNIINSKSGIKKIPKRHSLSFILWYRSQYSTRALPYQLF